MTEPAPIAYRFRWTPELYAEIVGRPPPAALGLAGSRRALAGAVLATAGLVAALVAAPAALGLYPARAVLVGLWGAVAALLAVLLVVVPHLRRSRIAADLATRARQGEIAVTLAADGIATASALAAGTTRWPGVTLVSDGSRALLIWTGAAFALPLPDAALPPGLDRAAARARIEAWREAAR